MNNRIQLCVHDLQPTAFWFISTLFVSHDKAFK